MKTVLCAVLLLAPLAGCAISSETEQTEQTGSTSQAATPVDHSIASKPGISQVPLSGAISVSHAGAADLPDPPPTPVGPLLTNVQ